MIEMLGERMFIAIFALFQSISGRRQTIVCRLSSMCLTTVKRLFDDVQHSFE